MSFHCHIVREAIQVYLVSFGIFEYMQIVTAQINLDELGVIRFKLVEQPSVYMLAYLVVVVVMCGVNQPFTLSFQLCPTQP